MYYPEMEGIIFDEMFQTIQSTVEVETSPVFPFYAS